jgi:hypothetical protein
MIAAWVCASFGTFLALASVYPPVMEVLTILMSVALSILAIYEAWKSVAATTRWRVLYTVMRILLSLLSALIILEGSIRLLAHAFD